MDVTIVFIMNIYFRNNIIKHKYQYITYNNISVYFKLTGTPVSPGGPIGPGVPLPP